MPPDDAASSTDLAAAGWKPMPAEDYPALIGPFLARRDGDGGGATASWPSSGT